MVAALLYLFCGLEASKSGWMMVQVSAGGVFYFLTAVIYFVGAVVLALGLSWWGIAAVLPATLMAWGARVFAKRAGLPADRFER